jgi:hypothetical protein
MATYREAYVCRTCALFIANGEVPVDEPNWEPDDSVFWLNGDSNKDEYEVTFKCECCGKGSFGTKCHVYYEDEED